MAAVNVFLSLTEIEHSLCIKYGAEMSAIL